MAEQEKAQDDVIECALFSNLHCFFLLALNILGNPKGKSIAPVPFGELGLPGYSLT